MRQWWQRSSWKTAIAVLIGSSMLSTAAVAAGGKPVQGSTTEGNPCGVFAEQEYFYNACEMNVKVALRMLSTDAAYTGSCEGGGACADSVYNKLQAAASKFAAPKVADGCAKLADIQTDLTTWNTADKQKINNNGYTEMSKIIRDIQTYNCP